MTTLARTLAAHFAALALSDIPAAQVESLKHLILDFWGVAAAGSGTSSGRLALQYALRSGGSPEATLIGTDALISAPEAAFANAISAHSLELDDVDSRALFHFGPPVVGAALAVCEAADGSGEDLLVGVAAGCEMLSRLSEAANPELRNRGFHTTAVGGAFGAAIAAGRVLGLNAEQMTSALGMAGAQASGLMEMYGPSMQKRFNAGPAARGGVTAAVLAQIGFTGADTIFEGERGFARAFCGGSFDHGSLVRGLGADFPVEIEFKAYACARPIHPAIDACLALRERVSSLDEVEEIIVRRHPAWADYHLNAMPRTYHEAQVSLPFSVAVALKEGQALFEQYQEPYLSDPFLQTLASRVRVVPDPALPSEVGVAVAMVTGGQTLAEAQVDYPKGSLQNPLSQAEMEGKFRRLASHAFSDAVIDQLRAQLMTVETIPSVRAMTALVRTDGPTREV